MSTKFLHIGSHTGHCHKWAHVSHAELHTLHLSVLSLDPLSHSPLWSMFLNQDACVLVSAYSVCQVFPYGSPWECPPYLVLPVLYITGFYVPQSSAHVFLCQEPSPPPQEQV